MIERKARNNAALNLRVPQALVDRIDALVAGLQDENDEFHNINRSTIIRAALQRGLDALEAEAEL